MPRRLGTQAGLHCGHQGRLVGRRPLLHGVENHEDIGDIDAHGIGGDFWSPRLGHHRLHLVGKRLQQNRFEAIGASHRLPQSNRRQTHHLNGQSPFVEAGNELRSQKGDHCQRTRQHRDGDHDHPPRMAKGGIERGLVATTKQPQEAGLLLGHAALEHHRRHGGHPGERQHQRCRQTHSEARGFTRPNSGFGGVQQTTGEGQAVVWRRAPPPPPPWRGGRLGAPSDGGRSAPRRRRRPQRRRLCRRHDVGGIVGPQ